MVIRHPTAVEWSVSADRTCRKWPAGRVWWWKGDFPTGTATLVVSRHQAFPAGYRDRTLGRDLAQRFRRLAPGRLFDEQRPVGLDGPRKLDRRANRERLPHFEPNIQIRASAAPDGFHSAKTGNKDDIFVPDLLERVKEHLDEGLPVRTMTFNDKEWPVIRNRHMITLKPVMYIANVDESGFENNPYLDAVREHAENEGAQVVAICARSPFVVTGGDGWT